MLWFKALALLAVSALATASPTARVALEADVNIAAYQRGWQSAGRADGAAMLEMTFAIKQQNLDQLTNILVEISDPTNPKYGQHLTKDQVDALVAPTKEATTAVNNFVFQHGVSCNPSGSAALVCQVPVAVAEEMLAVEYHNFVHVETGAAFVRANTHYTVPASVAPHLDLVSPTNRLPGIRIRKNVSNSAPLRTNTPSSLRELYSVGDVEGTASTNRLACTAFLKQHYKPEDLTKFWNKYYPKAVGRKINVIGPDPTLFPGVEASLDIEYITTMGGGVPAEFWSFAGTAPDNPQNEPFLTWIYLVGNTSDDKVPKVFSTSYGEPEDTVSYSYMNRIESEFIKTGARGITLFFASGDSGVAPDDGICKNGRFAGQWPAGSPWVTGVGGTEGGSTTEPEAAWGGSSGGFSDRWTTADFQSEAVSHYLSTANPLPDEKHYNKSGRGFPDVSAQGTNFLVINGGFTEPVAGTSCACPTFSGVFGLLNDLRLQSNKSTLGFVNPLFYKNPQMFNDITSGSNPGGGSCGDLGFKAIEGWDPVTGLGTPNYAKMADVVKKLP